MPRLRYTHGWCLGIATFLGIAAGGPGRAGETQEPPEIPQLKDLCLNTDIVRDGAAQATIVAPASGVYSRQVETIVAAIADLTGVNVPVANDDSPAAAVPFQANVIALGNRSINRFISELYDRHYVILDLKYPGPGGHVVRTLHNPYGDGKNVVFVGGSDGEGVAGAAQVFIEELRGAAKDQTLTLGWLAKIQLGTGTEIPAEVDAMGSWDESFGYAYMSGFGWNALSKRMALYYMTGDNRYAREFLRLAFPDEKAATELGLQGSPRQDIDLCARLGQSPLTSWRDHYSAHMMILYWDLIEESPVFTDDERLRVTRALADQLRSPIIMGGHSNENPQRVLDRHVGWAAVCRYCLGRYFQKSYPNPVWDEVVEYARTQFLPLRDPQTWENGTSRLDWYATGIEPSIFYVALSGDAESVQHGIVPDLLRWHEILISGREPGDPLAPEARTEDWALRYAGMGYLHKAAYLTGDGRWITYRQRTSLNPNRFRVGQSFWPDERLVAKSPEDLVGQWTVRPVPEVVWRNRGSGLQREDSFYYASFRSAPDWSGDFILLDGYNKRGRHPYHSFTILQLRIGPYTLLGGQAAPGHTNTLIEEGYLNQVNVSMDGICEPDLAMDAALVYKQVLGGTAVAIGEVPKASYSTWRRAIVQRIGKYCVIVDDLAFRIDSDNAEVEIEWEMAGTCRAFPDGHVESTVESGPDRRNPVPGGQIRPADRLPTVADKNRATMQWAGSVGHGQHQIFFTLLGVQPGAEKYTLRCERVAANAAALALPEPGVAVSGRYQDLEGELVVMAADHLFGKSLRRAGEMLSADRPVDADWDYTSGRAHVTVSGQARLGMRLGPGRAVRVDGAATSGTADPDGWVYFDLVEGSHVLEGALPDPASTDRTRGHLASLSGQGLPEPPRPPSPAKPRELASSGGTRFGKPLSAFAVIPAKEGDLLCAAEGKTIHVLTPAGQEIRALPADDNVRVLRWWPEHGLLLAGGADDKVIAFDAEGTRKWEFRSESHEHTLRENPGGWLRTEENNKGIHGLYTGVFLNRQSQAFVGSACTLEILDESGRLLQRLPQHYGNVTVMGLAPGADGTMNLVAARSTGLNDEARVINSARLLQEPPYQPGMEPYQGTSSFGRVPPGHPWLPGSVNSNRRHVFCEDLDGDGRTEVVTDVNGTWNRVGVWDVNGGPKYLVDFGPRSEFSTHDESLNMGATNVRGLILADLDGDGRQEIVVALWRGLILALNSRCEKVWARRLPSPPTVLAGATLPGEKTPWLVAGCEDGSVLVLNGRGTPIRAGSVPGRPTGIAVLADSKRDPYAAIGTEEGEVRTFQLSRE